MINLSIQACEICYSTNPRPKHAKHDGTQQKKNVSLRTYDI